MPDFCLNTRQCRDTENGIAQFLGNPNILALDIGTPRLAQGPIAHACLVDIEYYSGPLPRVTAFDPPEILRENESASN
jgi:biotin/methionine sulfoxide reductase